MDDFPAAALAALLSPCLLLTHNYKHFGALGVRTRMQGVDSVMAVLAINIGGSSCRRSSSSRLPFRVVGAAMEWATEKIGPLAWVILGVGVAGGIVWYCKQPPERRPAMRLMQEPAQRGVRSGDPGQVRAACDRPLRRFSAGSSR